MLNLYHAQKLMALGFFRTVKDILRFSTSYSQLYSRLYFRSSTCTFDLRLLYTPYIRDTSIAIDVSTEGSSALGNMICNLFSFPNYCQLR